jgi:RsiW-degrading membrane proteinase PrsW (M82 family)
MLQRIQTVWLFLASAALFCLFLFPYLHIIGDDGKSKEIKVTGVYENLNGQAVQTEPFLLLTIVTVVIALLPFIIVFYYANRKRQMMMCYIAIVAIIGHYYWLVSNSKHVIGATQLQIGNLGIGAILPSIAIILILMAVRGIRHDEKLIKSADRLR